MGFDFPGPPLVVGAVSNGYAWDGEKWTATTALGAGGPPGPVGPTGPAGPPGTPGAPGAPGTGIVPGTAGYHFEGLGTGATPDWKAFQQAGTGAVLRTWQNKGRDAVSIIDFLDQATFLANQGSVTLTGTGMDCSYYFAAAFQSSTPNGNVRLVLPPGNYRIGPSIGFDWGANSVIEFMPGAVLCPDSGITVTIKNPIIADPGHRIFGNNGFIVGLREVYPEWWGAVSNGSTPCSTAINAAIWCGEHAGGSVGHYLMLFQSGTYLIDSQLTFNMDLADWTIQGAGQSTKLVGSSSGSGSCMAVICTGNANFEISDFGIINQVANAGFTYGFFIAANGNHHYSLIENVDVSGFSINWLVNQPTRLVKWDHCSGWRDAQSGGAPTNPCNLFINNTTAGTHVGDLDFHSCQWVASGDGGATTGTNVLLRADGSVAHITGIRFFANIFYFAQTSFVMSITGGGTCDDIWIETCQFEGANSPGTQAINASVNGSGFIRDFHVNHNYFAGYGYNYHIISTCSGGSVPGMWFITNNFFNGGTAASVLIDATGSTFTGYVFNGNIQRDCAAGGDINTLINMYYVTCTGNTVSGSTTGNRYFSTGGGGDWHVITGNNSAGQRSTPYFVAVTNALYSGLNL